MVCIFLSVVDHVGKPVREVYGVVIPGLLLFLLSIIICLSTFILFHGIYRLVLFKDVDWMLNDIFILAIYWLYMLKRHPLVSFMCSHGTYEIRSFIFHARMSVNINKLFYSCRYPFLIFHATLSVNIHLLFYTCRYPFLIFHATLSVNTHLLFYTCRYPFLLFQCKNDSQDSSVVLYM